MTDPTHNEASAKPEALLFTAIEAAQALRIGARTLWQLTDEGAIPVLKIGRSVRYDPRDLTAWIDRTKRWACDRNGQEAFQVPDPDLAAAPG